ncbi:MAG: hypothetical protein HKO89_02495, partial [Saprospiraceae bacterium]|nr:hypothetical protein [Saprospiraceae bacterium]
CIAESATIGDFVWNDLNGNGLQDSGEPGVENVIVELIDNNGDVINTTTTDNTGAYQFMDILPGNYQLRFDISLITDPLTFTLPDIGGDDNLDSDVTASGFTEFISLEAGDSFSNWDAGLVRLTNIGDYVWEDLNGNGIQESGEPGIADVGVELYSSNGSLLKITNTDQSGNYEFNDVYPGNYYVKFRIQDPYQPTFSHSNSDDSKDSDIDNSFGIGTTDLIEVNVGSDDFDIDAGLVRCIPVGEQVWFDYNENDLWDEDENGINQMKVELYRFQSGSWILWDITFTALKPGTGSDDGYYKFCVMPGRYYIRFVNPPTTLVPARANRGPENIDSDITGRFGQGTTDDFTVSSGEEKCDIGAGYYKMGTIGDYVWNDSNDNGLREPGENGVSGVIVEAINDEGDVMGMAVTDNSGNYFIDYLGQADYYIKFNLPPGFTLSTPLVGNDPSIDSDVDGSNGPLTTRYFNVMPGQHVPNVDAGVLYSPLPVEWLDFWGENRDNHNYIEWSLVYEFNLSHYEIERSVNNIENFVKIGEVDPDGSSPTEVSYNYEDFDLYQDGVYYYRIKQYDLNGDYDYSKIVAINLGEVEDTGRHKAHVYPIPVVNELTVELEIMRDVDEISVHLYDGLGRMVRKNLLVDINIEAGVKQYKLDMTDLTQGVYSLSIHLDKHKLVEKIIVLGK